MNGLAALRHVDAPVRIVVLNNDGGGIFEFLPQATQIERDEFEAILGTPLGLETERIAALYEIPYARVTNLAELAAASATTALIEVPVARSDSVALHKRLGELAAEALERALA
jgi:2-succinyl-5-enolpyruvyl-6-hydroxy-3-cyclohexene-1-carboxylate synthase